MFCRAVSPEHETEVGKLRKHTSIVTTISITLIPLSLLSSYIHPSNNNYPATRILQLYNVLNRTGSAREIPGASVEPAAREVGRVGPHAAVGGAVLGRQHLQQPEAGVHLQRQPAPRPAAGVAQPHGSRHTQVLRPRHFGHFRILLR